MVRTMPESKSYVVTGVPTSVLIDCSTGLIVGRELYGDMLDAKLEGCHCRSGKCTEN